MQEANFFTIRPPYEEEKPTQSRQVVAGVPIQKWHKSKQQLRIIVVGRRSGSGQNFVIIDRSIIQTRNGLTGTTDTNDCRILLGRCGQSHSGTYVVKPYQNGHITEGYLLFFEGAHHKIRTRDERRILVSGTLRSGYRLMLLAVRHRPLIVRVNGYEQAIWFERNKLISELR